MEKKKFEFKYSAPSAEERKEIEYIQSQYKEKNKSMTKLEYLRKLDGKVKNIPVCVSLVLGVVGLLIFGLGLTMILEWNLVVWGVIIGVISLIPMGFAYFSYEKLSKKLKDKYKDEILDLTNELLNEKK